MGCHPTVIVDGLAPRGTDHLFSPLQMAVPQPAPVELDEEPAPSLAARAREIVAVPARLLGALLLPDRVLPRQVDHERYGSALLATMIAALLAAGAIALRYDVTASVLERNAGRKLAPAAAASSAPGAAAEEPPKSDREIQEQIAKERSVGQVKLGLAAGLGTPAWILLLAVGLYLVGRYVGGKPTFRRALTAAAHASLPGAVKSCVTAVIAFRLPAVRPNEVDALVSASPVLHHPIAARLFGGVDLFVVWTAVLCGFGLAAAGRMSRTRAFITVLVSFVLWLALTRLACGGPAGGPGPGGPR